LMRLVVPFALVTALVSSALGRSTVLTVMFWIQIAVYCLSVLALAKVKLGPLSRISDAAATLVVLNAAALAAFVNFLTGKKVAWMPIAPTGGTVRGALEKEVQL